MKKTCSKIDCAHRENKIHLNNVNSTHIWQLRKTRVEFVKTYFLGGQKVEPFLKGFTKRVNIIIIMELGCHIGLHVPKKNTALKLS